MNKTDKYLESHIIQDHGYCIQYDNFKATILGSYKGLVYWKDDIYYFQGLEGTEYLGAYGNNATIDIPLFRPH